MTRLQTKRFVVVLASAGAILAWTACNVWGTLENCSTNSDCPQHQSCDLSVGLCLVTDAGGTSVQDTSIVDRVDATIVDARSDAKILVEADIDAAPPCILTVDFAADASLLPGFEDQEIESARLSPDELTLYYAAYTSSATGFDLYQTSRNSVNDAFPQGTQINGVNSAADEYWPSPSPPSPNEGQVIYFESGRYINPTDAASPNDIPRIWTGSRENVLDGYTNVTVQSIFQIEAGAESAPYLHPLKQAMYFVSLSRPGLGDYDMFVAYISATGSITIQNLTSVNSSQEDNFPVVTDDQLTLYFSRPDVNATTEARRIMVATRATVDAAWASSNDGGVPREITTLNTPYDEFPAYPTANGCTLYFISNRPTPDAGPEAGAGPYHVWTTHRPPRVP